MENELRTSHFNLSSSTSGLWYSDFLSGGNSFCSTEESGEDRQDTINRRIRWKDANNDILDSVVQMTKARAPKPRVGPAVSETLITPSDYKGDQINEHLTSRKECPVAPRLGPNIRGRVGRVGVVGCFEKRCNSCKTQVIQTAMLLGMVSLLSTLIGKFPSYPSLGPAGKIHIHAIQMG